MNPFDKVSHSLAVKAAPYSANPDAEQNVEILQYGIYLMLADLSKYTILLVIAYFMDLLPYAAFSLVSIGILRMYMGGVHAKTYLGCLISTVLLFLGIAYLAKNIILHANPTIIVLSYGICLYSIFTFAPADHENKPVRDKKHRKHLRHICLGLSTAYFILALTFSNNPYSVILVFSFIVNSLIILPLMYKLTNNKNGEHYSDCDVNAEGT